MFYSPRVNTIVGMGSPEELTQVLANTLPEDLTRALTLFTITHQKLIQIQNPTADRLRGDDGYCTVPEEQEAVHNTLQLLTEHSPCYINKVLSLTQSHTAYCISEGKKKLRMHVKVMLPFGEIDGMKFALKRADVVFL